MCCLVWSMMCACSIHKAKSNDFIWCTVDLGKSTSLLHLYLRFSTPSSSFLTSVLRYDNTITGALGDKISFYHHSLVYFKQRGHCIILLKKVSKWKGGLMWPDLGTGVCHLIHPFTGWLMQIVWCLVKKKNTQTRHPEKLKRKHDIFTTLIQNYIDQSIKFLSFVLWLADAIMVVPSMANVQDARAATKPGWEPVRLGCAPGTLHCQI